ncbi:unnamed protein product [Sphagnum balticum]
MVKKSKKSKSKRMPLRKKYKILKKVKEHHKKKAKEAKKAGTNKKAKVEKDPGIPNAWPFKEQELAALEARRARAVEELEQKKQAKKERAQKRKLGLLDTEEDEDLSQLAKDASKRSLEFDKRKKPRVSETVSPQDGSRRAFYKEFMKVVEASDVVIQVLDARDPLGSRCVDVERMVHKAGPTKRIVLLLNKIDLVPREVVERWLKYLREELPTVAFKCNTQQQRTNLGRKSSRKATENAEVLQTSDCLGAETLLQLLKNYSRNQQLKTGVVVGVVGFPNVGKSSLINSLKRTRVASVGATPGVTKAMQEIHLDKHVKLLDCPGIVFASPGDNEASATLRNCTKVERLADPITPVKEILRLCPTEKLMSIYKVPQFSNEDEFLLNVATVRGKLKRGGVGDSVAAARMVLHDWNEGKIPYFTTPPAREVSEHAESSIVATWGKEFDVEDVFKNEESTVIAGLPSLVDTLHVEMPSTAPLTMDIDIPEGDSENEEEEEEEEEEAGEDAGLTEMDTAETAVVTRGRAYLNQNDRLYDEEGIQNPHAKRAEKKRRKKAGKQGPAADAKEANDDYDFNVDYQDGQVLLPEQEEDDTDEDEEDEGDAMDGVN